MPNPVTLIDETIAGFDDLSMIMRSIELDADEDLQGVSFGVLTFTSCLDNIGVYFTLAKHTGALSENLQHRFAEAITEMYVTMTRIQHPIFDQTKLIDMIKDVDQTWLSELDYPHAVRAINACAGALNRYDKLDEGDKLDDKLVWFIRAHVVTALICLNYVRHELVTIDINPLTDGLDDVTT